MFKDYTLIELIDKLVEVTKINDSEPSPATQRAVNSVAYELATRIYIPNKNESFEEILEKFGYYDPDLIDERPLTR